MSSSISSTSPLSGSSQRRNTVPRSTRSASVDATCELDLVDRRDLVAGPELAGIDGVVAEVAVEDAPVLEPDQAVRVDDVGSNSTWILASLAIVSRVDVNSSWNNRSASSSLSTYA